MRTLVGCRALVTGGGKRLGRAIVLALADAGCDVAVHYNTSRDGAEETVEAVKRFGRDGFTVCADLSIPDAPTRIKQEVRARWDGIDILINSASPWPSPARVSADNSLLQASLEDWELALSVNARAPFFLIQAFAADLRARGKGAVINILDQAVSVPYLKRSCHSVGKSALQAITKIAAMSLDPDVRVNALELGPTLPADEMEESERVKRKWAGVEEATAAVLYLLRTESVTGETLRVGCDLPARKPAGNK